MKFSSTTNAKLFLRLCALCCLHMASAESRAQINPQSPYSRFVLGTLAEPGNVVAAGMGGITTWAEDRLAVNLYNPASYQGLVRTGFQAGAQGSMMTLNDGVSTARLSNAQPREIAFGFKRPGTRWGFALGLTPFSTSGYAITQTTAVENVPETTFSYDGSGGLNKAVAGASRLFRLSRPDSSDKPVALIAAGVNFNYYFGTITQQRKVVFSDVTFANSRITENTSYYGPSAEFGMMASLPLYSEVQDKEVKKSLKLQLGANYGLASPLTVRYSELAESFYFFAGQPIPIDTVSFTDDSRTESTLPSSLRIGGGLTFSHNAIGAISAGLEWRAQQWSSFALPFDQSSAISRPADASSLHAGVQFLPASDEKFLGRCTYRMGFRQSETYLSLRETAIRQQALSLGLTMPLLYSRTWSRLHFAVEWGSTGTNDNALLQEDFVNVMVGFTLSPFFKTDEWFMYRKYD